MEQCKKKTKKHFFRLTAICTYVTSYFLVYSQGEKFKVRTWETRHLIDFQSNI